MSMIGLFTAGTHAANAPTATDDPATASGFGAALQGALDALTGSAGTPAEQAPTAPTEELPTESDALLAELVVGMATPQTAVPPLEMGETMPDGSEAESVNPAPLVELVETPTADPLPVPTTAATAPSAPAAMPPVPGGTPAAVDADTASESTAAGPAIATVAPAVEPSIAHQVRTPTGSAPGVPTDPSAEVDKPDTGSTVPAPPPTARSANASAVAAPLGQPVDARTGNPAPAPTSANGTVSSTVPAAARGSLENAAQVPTVVAAPSSTPAASVTPVTPVATPNPAASAPLATQLARPIFSLAAAGTGQHVMTVSVTPDNLGPVTLRAHVGADGVRVELFAPNDIGRDAIRAIIPELRRDLAGAGLGGNLTLSSQNQPSAGSDHSAAGQAGGRGDRDGTTHPAADGTRGGANDIPPTESDSRQRAFGSASTIDVLA